MVNASISVFVILVLRGQFEDLKIAELCDEIVLRQVLGAGLGNVASAISTI